ncbi:beta-xylosidase [Neurospora crassa OR74A]|uniref:Beta-xylosidase n=1 Tax=Neurospora crassa (strain ATCC 24698 / 74-OR23-1A / CBS 708.71 / DSM 1257 / FGSC 987) TaxID=367110 RepID=Q7S271_NEUCR|nr:beta-xylosidase [Neurospora crassa OR74A]EAA29482.1 beta-xylosidase [Neurospora crassa OR74A]|eukprot:XP_958718.1 beta-xylosidase [Neurospora crassa OR74A]
MPLVKNPILPGFNPDPSVLRVGQDYYIATSTFEWYPGVQIHHSTDLANWTLLTRPLNRKSQLDMRGDPDSCGVWAPCLSHDGDKFWLVYTDVKRKDGSFKDAHNFIVWADKIDGEWSDPVYVNSSGFDPSLFHDPDSGKKYFVNMLWDHRRRPLLFAGIAVQEWDAKTKKLVGERKNVYQGTELALAEAPHVYKRNGWYYLLIAEGGTGYEHACTLARSKDIWGPYKTHPEKHVLTSKDHPRAALQRAGHGDIVEIEDGRTYLVHLTGRPTTQLRRCVLGRETAIQECYWKDDWLYVKNGPVPSLWVDLLGERDESKYWEEKRYTFKDGLHKDFQWLRTPETERIFNVKDGKLTLIGREAIGSWFEQALVARRQEHFSYDAETVIDFSPTDERQFAGLTAYYCRYNFFYLTVTAHSDGQRELLIMSSEASWPIGNLNTPYVPYVQIPNEGKVKLALTIRGNQLQFYYAVLDSGDEELKKIGPVFDASIVSDECGGHQQHGSFTGAFVGVAASDLNGLAAEAKFDYLLYKPVKNQQDAYVRDNE